MFRFFALLSLSFVITLNNALPVEFERNPVLYYVAEPIGENNFDTDRLSDEEHQAIGDIFAIKRSFQEGAFGKRNFLLSTNGARGFGKRDFRSQMSSQGARGYGKRSFELVPIGARGFGKRGFDVVVTGARGFGKR